MRKFIITFLCLIPTIFVFGQTQPIVQANRITVIHLDKDNYNLIDPTESEKRGLIEIVYELFGDEWPEEFESKYVMDEDQFLYLIEDDPDMNIVNVKEVAPPKGYYESTEKEIIFFNENKNITGHLYLDVDDTFVWDKINTNQKYFTVIFYNKKKTEIEKETFWYQFMGGESWEGNSPKQIKVPITAIRIGEYYWMENNFNAYDPYENNPMYAMQKFKITDQTMANYFKTILLPDSINWKELYDVTPEQIDKCYGIYFEEWATYRLHHYGKFTTDEAQTQLNYPDSRLVKDQWRLAFREDIRQLFAMSPFANDIEGSQNRITLNGVDIVRALGASTGDNECAKDFHLNSATRTYWYGLAQNIYGFNLMPSGWRSMIDLDWFTNGVDSNDYHKKWYMQNGDIAQMFYTAYFRIGNKSYPALPYDVAVLAEGPNTKESLNKPWKRFTFRWMRKMTDQELGYKLYVKVDGLQDSSEEWTKMKAGDEIPLLIAIRNGEISPNNVKIQKRNLSDMTGIDNSYIELPNGYLRGFYVQHYINSSIPKTVSEIALYASQVEDNVLGYNPSWYNPTRSTKATTQIIENTTSIYPNPVYDVVNISSASDIKSISVNSLTTGREYIKVNRLINNTLDLSKLPAGIYVMQIETATGIETHKILKK